MVKTVLANKEAGCPACGGKVIKFGFKRTRKGQWQQYQCKICARVFTEENKTGGL